MAFLGFLASVAVLVAAAIHRSYLADPLIYRDRRVLLLLGTGILFVGFCGVCLFLAAMNNLVHRRYSLALISLAVLIVMVAILGVACYVDSPTIFFAS